MDCQLCGDSHQSMPVRRFVQALLVSSWKM